MTDSSLSAGPAIPSSSGSPDPPPPGIVEWAYEFEFAQWFETEVRVFEYEEGRWLVRLVEEDLLLKPDIRVTRDDGE